MSFLNRSNPRWWHWCLAAVAVGAAVGMLRRWHNEDLNSLGTGLNSRASFEQALTSEVGGRPLFCDLTVYACRIPDGEGASRPVHVVRGLYCDGEPDPRDHKLHWRPTFFLAPVPYPVDLANAAEANPGNPPATVLDLLDSLGRTAGVRYTNAWWDSYPLATSLGGSLLLLGLLCPMLMNLLTYGRPVAPRQAPGVSLWRVRVARGRKPGPAVRAQLPVTQRVVQAPNDVEEKPTPPPAAAPPAPVQALRIEPAPAAPAPRPEATAFGAGAEDYYPTACHAQQGRSTP